MSRRIRRCPHDRRYTLCLICPVCGRPTRTAHPARFSPEDSTVDTGGLYEDEACHREFFPGRRY
ncbi:MAG: nucleolar RNA-binding Nop10p family protein [Methanoculleus sp.]